MNISIQRVCRIVCSTSFVYSNVLGRPGSMLLSLLLLSLRYPACDYRPGKVCVCMHETVLIYMLCVYLSEISPVFIQQFSLFLFI